MKEHQVIMSGAGGQGLMFIGKMLVKLAVDIYSHVTFFPSYGAEVRGGTSNCQIRLSEELIATPMIENPSLLVLANQASVDRFLTALAPDGQAFVNSSMASADDRPGVSNIPASQLAMDLGNARVANVVLYGAMLRHAEIVDYQKALDELAEVSASKGDKIVEINRKAFEAGWNFKG